MAAMNRHAFRTIPGWLAALLAFALGPSGCNYFRPADPEPPSGAAIIADYGLPEATLQTMALGIADKARTNGASVYVGAFAESFRQFYDSNDSTKWSSTSGRPAPPWNLALERNFYTRFITLYPQGYQMQWTEDPPNPDDQGDTEWAIHRHYLVITEPGDTIAIGYADLTFQKSAQQQWLITQWGDRADLDRNLANPELKTLGLRRLETQ